MDYEDYCEYDYYIGRENITGVNCFSLRTTQIPYHGLAQLVYAEQLKQKNLLNEKIRNEKKEKEKQNTEDIKKLYTEHLSFKSNDEQKSLIDVFSNMNI